MKKISLLLSLIACPAFADAPTVIDATASNSGSKWRFDVTLEHPDTGWDHYADGWRIESNDGSVLGIRELVHPHENEQPFTRSLSGVSLPSGTSTVQIRARCNVDGWSTKTFKLDLDEM